MKKLLIFLFLISAFLAYGQDDTTRYYGNQLFLEHLYFGVNRIDLVNDGVSIATYVPLNSDTIAMYQFGAIGSSNFSTDNDIEYGSYQNVSPGDTAVLIGTLSTMQGSSPSLAIQLYKDDNLVDATPSNCFSSSQTITSTTSGDYDYFPANTYLLPGQALWLETTTVTTAPDYLSVIVFVKWLNRSF